MARFGDGCASPSGGSSLQCSHWRVKREKPDYRKRADFISSPSSVTALAGTRRDTFPRWGKDNGAGQARSVWLPFSIPSSFSEFRIPDSEFRIYCSPSIFIYAGRAASNFTPYQWLGSARVISMHFTV